MLPSRRAGPVKPVGRARSGRLDGRQHRRPGEGAPARTDHPVRRFGSRWPGRQEGGKSPPGIQPRLRGEVRELCGQYMGRGGIGPLPDLPARLRYCAGRRRRQHQCCDGDDHWAQAGHGSIIRVVLKENLGEALGVPKYRCYLSGSRETVTLARGRTRSTGTGRATRAWCRSRTACTRCARSPWRTRHGIVIGPSCTARRRCFVLPIPTPRYVALALVDGRRAAKSAAATPLARPARSRKTPWHAFIRQSKYPDARAGRADRRGHRRQRRHRARDGPPRPS